MKKLFYTSPLACTVLVFLALLTIFTPIPAAGQAGRQIEVSEGVWGALSDGLNGDVEAMAVFNGDLYVGGFFTDAGGVADADRIARWDGTQWHAVGSGLSSGWVRDMFVVGSDLYVVGTFYDLGGIIEADHLARWDGTQWHAVVTPGGLMAPNGARTVAVIGSDVYVGGNFIDHASVPDADWITRWDGTQWRAVGSGLNGWVNDLAVIGSTLYVGGNFTDAGGVTDADRIAAWNGSSWQALGSGLANGQVYALHVNGTDLYTGGTFANAGGVADADYIGRWDGTQWHAVAAGITNTVNAILVEGSHIYVGGGFQDAGGLPEADRIVYWDGANWQALVGLNASVYTLVNFNDQLIAGGNFTDAGGTAEGDYITVWQNEADLRLSISDSPDPIRPGQQLTYLISVTNDGPGAATNLVVTDPLPTGTNWITFGGIDWDCTESGGTITCTRDTLASGDTAPNILISVGVSGVSAPGTIENTPSVSAGSYDPDPGNNTSTAATTVQGEADLSVSQIAAPDPVLSGGNLTYTLSVNNAGPDAAYDLTLVDTLPAGTTFQGASGTGWACSHNSGTVTCTRDDLAAGDAPAIALTVAVPITDTETALTNSVMISAASTDPDTSGNDNDLDVTLTPWQTFLPLVTR
jgi:uncharacterized repeat protein (TIGR01451 family)